MSQPELSSPLEWLLQSPQSTPEALALAAWDACGASLLALGAWLFGGEQAETFAALSLAETLLRAAAYRGDTPPCAWVLHLAAEGAEGLVPRGQREEARRRAACFLREAAGEGQSRAEAEGEAASLEMRVAKREAAVLQNAAPLPAFHNGGAAGQGEISPGPSPAWVAQAVALAAAREEQRSRLTRLKEALLVLFLAAAALVGLRIGGALDTHHDLPVETQVVVVEVTPAPRVVTVAITTTPVPPLEMGALPVPTSPLTGDVSPAEVLSLLRRSSDSWRTLWVDAFIADYGPEGYTGPPHVEREQAWIVQGSRSLVLLGPEGGPPAQLALLEHGEVYRVSLPYRKSREMHRGGGPEDVPPVHPLLWEMLRPALLLEGGTPALHLRGLKPAAATRRLALRMDVLRPGGLREAWWVDVRYGILLRRGVYTRRGALAYEVVVDDVAFNFIPEGGLFAEESAPTRFAISPRGDAEPLDARPVYRPVTAPPGHFPLPRFTPLPDFDPAAARLTFQWDTWLPPWEPDSETAPFPPGTDVRVFAEGYYLGDLPDVTVKAMTPCVRSSDGRLLVWLYPVVNPGSGDGLAARGVRLGKDGFRPLRLDFGSGEEEGFVRRRSWMVFSPDGQYLYYAADSEANGMGIYRLQRGGDAYGSSRRLFGTFHTGPLAISPSGGQLAWLEYRDTDTWELVLADLQSETILSRQVVTIQMAEDGMPVSVPSVWGKPFPWPQPGLLNCEEP